MKNRELLRDYQVAISDYMLEHDGDIFLTIPTGGGLSTIVLDYIHNSTLNILLITPSDVIKENYKCNPFYHDIENITLITNREIKLHNLTDYDIVIIDMWYSGIEIDISIIKKMIILNPSQITIMNKRENTRIIRIRTQSGLTRLVRRLKIKKLMT